MEENKQFQQRERDVFDVIYLVVLLAVIGYAIYIFGFKFDDYSEEELIKTSYYFAPGLLFSLTGMLTVKTERSIVYAIIAGAASFGLLLAFFNLFWEML